MFRCCWERDFASTYQNMTQMVHKLEEKGYLDIMDLDEKFREHCTRSEEMVTRANHLFEPVSYTHLIGGLEIDPLQYEVRKNGEPVELTLREFELLKFMADSPGRIFSRESLLEKVWGYEYFGDVRTVDVTISRLREKIETDPARNQVIMTKRGVGYYFAKEENK